MADLVLTNAHILTLEPEQPRAEAIAVRNGRIWKVGSTADILAAAGPDTERIDLGGKLVLPGLTDAHGHLMGLGDHLANLDVTGTQSAQEVAGMVAERADGAAEGEWILGRGWDQNDWSTKEFPDHSGLTRAAPGNPVVLRRVDGHAVWLNARALEIAGITAATPDPPGGKIERAGGHPTGILIDNAVDLVQKWIPEPSRDEQLRRLEAASRACLRDGLTSIHDAGIDWDRVGLYQEMIDQGRLKLRIYAMIGIEPTENRTELRPPIVDYGNGMLAVRSIKLYMDGALGSRGAALLEPYADDPENRGLLIHPAAKVTAVAAEAMATGYQVNIHAIGDRGNRLALDALEEATRQAPIGAALRHRIEHAQVLEDADIPRFAKLGVIASMQPTHCTSDMYWAAERLGETRARGAYAWNRLRQTGARLACGSDFPVESQAPLEGIYAAVTRQDRKGWPAGGWHPEERMSLEEAIRCFTIDAAYAAFEEEHRGTIRPGKRADFTVLDNDITALPPEEILKTGIEMTIVGGEIVYRAGDKN
ncbi:MAG: amidohydrolase [Acidobacteria bacterium]|nr:amidohydrolase [Acidobacteriota bacterium]